MEEYVHTTRMSSLATKANRIFRLTKEHNSKTEKVEKSEIKQWSLVVEHKFQ